MQKQPLPFDASADDNWGLEVELTMDYSHVPEFRHGEDGVVVKVKEHQGEHQRQGQHQRQGENQGDNHDRKNQLDKTLQKKSWRNLSGQSQEVQGKQNQRQGWNAVKFRKSNEVTNTRSINILEIAKCIVLLT